MLIQIIKQPMQTKNIHIGGYIYLNCEQGKESDIIFNGYLNTLTPCPYIGDEKLQDGVEMVEGVDYEIKHQYKSIVHNRWKNTEAEGFEKINYEKRIVAIGIPKATVAPSFNSTILENKMYTPPLSEKTEEKEKKGVWSDVIDSVLPLLESEYNLSAAQSIAIGDFIRIANTMFNTPTRKP